MTRDVLKPEKRSAPRSFSARNNFLPQRKAKDKRPCALVCTEIGGCERGTDALSFTNSFIGVSKATASAERIRGSLERLM